MKGTGGFPVARRRFQPVCEKAVALIFERADVDLPLK
jgi:hypothetical protein